MLIETVVDWIAAATVIISLLRRWPGWCVTAIGVILTAHDLAARGF
jgi:hypothetical protein